MTGKPCPVCHSEWCSIYTSLGVPHGRRVRPCCICGKPKEMHVNTMTCQDCIRPFLEALWGDDIWILDTIGKPQPIPSAAACAAAAPAKKRNHNGRRTRR